MKIFDELKPASNPRLMDLVEYAGIDVSDWSNFKGGAQRAATNPKYCYEWCFETAEVTLLNMWFDTLESVDGEVAIQVKMRARAMKEKGVRVKRCLLMDKAIADAYSKRKLIKVIILLNGQTSENRKVIAKRLDTEFWHVREYHSETGNALLVRGKHSIEVEESIIPDPEAEEFTDGILRKVFYAHRKRERRLRDAKLASHARMNGGQYLCEVPRCGFNFSKKYGEIGEKYAQVHHLEPLSTAPETGRKYTLNDVAVVCANCHVMIHRGGKCRELDTLIPEST